MAAPVDALELEQHGYAICPEVLPAGLCSALLSELRQMKTAVADLVAAGELEDT